GQKRVLQTLAGDPMDARSQQPDNDDAGVARIAALRVWILGILFLGLLGTVTELALLGHYEEPLQFVPLILIVVALPALGWEFSRRDSTRRRAMQILMVLFVLAGFAGFAAHFHGSAQYHLELNPDMGNWELLEKILRAKAPPLLAPGMMLQLGLL